MFSFHFPWHLLASPEFKRVVVRCSLHLGIFVSVILLYPSFVVLVRASDEIIQITAKIFHLCVLDVLSPYTRFQEKKTYFVINFPNFQYDLV